MSKAILRCVGCLVLWLVSYSGFSQSNPSSTYNLSAAVYSLTVWPTTAPAGTYPNSMIFHTHTGAVDPVITTNTTTDYNSAYNLAINARVNGHATNGILFLNSGSNNFLGAAVLSLNTVSCSNINVSWVGRTQATGTRNYAIRLQYRIGNVGAFIDVPGTWEYPSNGVVNHSATVSCNLSTQTANAVDNQAEVQLRWKYFYYGSLTGTRPQLALDDISITRTVSGVNTIATGVIAGSPFCVTTLSPAPVSVPFSYAPSASFTSGSCTFTAELSNSAGVFSSPTAIGSILSNGSGAQTISANIPPGTGTGAGYRIRVVADVPAVIGAPNGVNLNVVLAPNDVTGEAAAPANNQVTISWTNPSNCFNEIMIVARAGASVVGVPVGNGSAYTANSTFGLGTPFGGGFVVYKGTASPQATLGLTNGTNYCFKIFVRYGTDWTPGIEVCATPNNGTIFKRGDFAIVGVNANNTACSGVSAQDEVSFVCFQDIINNTSLDITDNGWESHLLGKWGNAEGIIRATRSGGTITAGTVITFRFNSTGGYSAITPDASWTFTSLTPTSVNFPTPYLNMNSTGDQLYFLQGGVWNPGTNETTGDATYTGGVVLFGFNSATAWLKLQFNTTNSGLYPAIDCYSVAALTAQTNFFKFTGSLAAKTQRNWIDSLNSSSNWTAYTTCTNYNAGPPNYPGGVVLPISVGGFRKGYWTGSKTDAWHLCDNWENFEVPDSTYDVTFPTSGVINNCNLKPTDSAKCKDLNIMGFQLNGAGSNLKKIYVLGNLTITGGSLNFDDINPATADGEIHLRGNWTNTNEIFFAQGNSKVFFEGSFNQILSTPTKESFYQVELNNPAGLDISTKMELTSQLSFVNGKISTSSNEVHINGVGPTFITGHSQTRYINGNLRRNIQNGNTYDFPVGTATNYELATVQFNTATGLNNLLVDFKSPNSGTFPDPSICFINGTPINDMLNYGYWTVTPDNTAAIVNYNIALNERGHTNSVTPASRYGVIKRVNNLIDWDGNQGVHNNATQSEVGGTATAVRSGIASFSDFAIGFNNTLTVPLPIVLLDFDAVKRQSQIFISWQISNIDECSEMVLQHSTDGYSFVDLYTANCNYGIHDYSYIHAKPFATNFYRLKMISTNAHVEYSDVKMVNMTTSAALFNVWMNSDASFNFVSSVNDLCSLSIIDNVGKVVEVIEELAVNKNVEATVMVKKSLAPGMYLIKLSGSNTDATARLFVR